MLYNTNARLVRLEGMVHSWLMRFSITALRVSMGVLFLGFGVLKFVPGLSPAQDLVETTISVMSFGLVPGAVGLIVTAVLECLIGASLIAGRGLRVTVYLLAGELLGILSPLVLLPGRLFSGPGHAPTLEGQYVLKDLVLVAAAMVVATQFRGASITAPDDWDLGARAASVQDDSADAKPDAQRERLEIRGSRG